MISTTAGIKILDGAEAELFDCTMNNNHCAGVCAVGENTLVTMYDNVLMHNDKGIWGFNGAQLQINRVECCENREAQISSS